MCIYIYIYILYTYVNISLSLYIYIYIHIYIYIERYLVYTHTWLGHALPERGEALGAARPQARHSKD